MSSGQLKKFFTKRGIYVHKVEEGYGGFVATVDNAMEAVKAINNTSANISVIFIQKPKPLWRRLLRR